jgi:hypothetical protein
MTFVEWRALITERLKRSLPHLSVLDGDPGTCYVLGISAIDMVELYGWQVLLTPHKDPLRMVDGVLISRHQGMRLEPIRFNLTDEDFVKALSFIRAHLVPVPDPYEELYESE